MHPVKRNFFSIWLTLFYAGWMVCILAGGHVSELYAHWPIALAMSLGSYFAGSTPMGGGTVGFPVLVMLQGEPSGMGRDFGFAIQSIGMVSASLFIWSQGIRVHGSLLRWALLGSMLGTPTGLILLGDRMPSLWVQGIFSLLWGGFGILHLLKISAMSLPSFERVVPHARTCWMGLLLGFVGGSTVASLTGVGIDMILYMVLVIYYRTDLKTAIPTSVVLMAMTSVIGLFTQWATGQLDSQVWGHWLAAAPVVAVGAPFGAWVVSRMGREFSILLVSLLCLFQFAWFLLREREALGWAGITLCTGMLCLMSGLYCFLFQWWAKEPKGTAEVT